MLTVASAMPGITLERMPPSTMVFVNVVRMSELSSGPNSLRRITRWEIVRILRLLWARARRRKSAACLPCCTREGAEVAAGQR